MERAIQHRSPKDAEGPSALVCDLMFPVVGKSFQYSFESSKRPRRPWYNRGAFTVEVSEDLRGIWPVAVFAEECVRIHIAWHSLRYAWPPWRRDLARICGVAAILAILYTERTVMAYLKALVDLNVSALPLSSLSRDPVKRRKRGAILATCLAAQEIAIVPFGLPPAFLSKLGSYPNLVGNPKELSEIAVEGSSVLVQQVLFSLRANGIGRDTIDQ
ncbi:MAG: hypothetical protein JSS66_01250 [Armatimonadetes bacterium]|nr:hypothetical protein [Armatimonadota bacterium]